MEDIEKQAEHPEKPRNLAALPPEQRRQITANGGRASARAMSAEQRRARAEAGGRAAQAKGTCRTRWTREQASIYGRKGRQSARRRKEAS